MPMPPPSDHAPLTAADDALTALDQAGQRASALADELAGGFEDIEALRASAPEGMDASRDLDALLAAAAQTAVGGDYELTHAAVAEPVSAPLSNAAAPPAEPVVSSESDSEPTDHVAGPSAAVDDPDGLAGVALLDPEALAAEVLAAAADDAEAPVDDAEAFAAALLEEAAAREGQAPTEAAAVSDPAAGSVAAAPDAVVAAGPPEIDAQRIQDAIAEMEALLAEEQESADPDLAPADGSAEDSAEAAGPVPGADSAGDGFAAGDAGAGGEGGDDDALAGLFAAPQIGGPSEEDEGGGGPPVVARALGDEAEQAPPLHPDAAPAAAGSDGQTPPSAGASEAASPRPALFPLGWLQMLLALINRPLGRLSDDWRLAVSGVALAVAIPGALLLGYALVLK